ncbi:MAG TPA: carboxymuconolactone decarboxylase family protein, partial [Polyangiaceae bacterium]|nr:carboxymuconolactone decarboxylase family protein [Polyangiaceae bacterium]
MTRAFVSYDLDSAPAASRAILAENARKFGKIPSPLARLAVSPVTLQGALAGLTAFEHSTLAPLEREVLAMT